MKMLGPSLVLALLAASCSTTPVAHRVLVQGNGVLAVVEPDGSTSWSTAWGGIHDLHVLESGNIMVQRGAHEVVELDRTTGEVVWSYDSATSNGNEGRPVEVHAFQPLENERVMIVESGPARIIEVDARGKVQNGIPLTVDASSTHSDTRNARKTATGSYLVAHERDGKVREYDAKGSVIWEYDVPLFGRERAGGHGPEAFGNQLYSAVRLENGNTLIGTGNGHSVIEVTPEKEIVWQLEQQDLEGITLAWVTQVERLANGNTRLVNCHAGPDNPQIIEVTPAKQVVWTFHDFDTFGNSMPVALVLAE